MPTTINELPLIASIENILAPALTAHAGGGQALGTPLIHAVNAFSVVASSGDSALLFTPSSTGSDEVVVYNGGANAMDVFPAVGGNINSLAANAAFSVPAGAQVTFTSISGTKWVTSVSSASGTTTLTGDVTGTGAGSIATTLATVNASVGSFTNSNITVNAKGLITAASSGGVLNATVTFANTAARLVATPAFEGQLGIQIDTTPQSYYTGTSGVGGWERLNIAPYSVATGTNAYAITPNPPFFNAADAYTAGRQYLVQFTNANSAASTLNVNAFGAIAITKNGTVALGVGDIVAGKIYSLLYDGTQFQISDITATRVSRTVFVDYVNGTTAAAGALIERFDKPFSTKAEAMAVAKASMSPTATNRVLISVAMGTSSEPISFLSATLGVDWDLNGGSINVVAGAISAIDDGGFAVDTVIYNAHTIQTSAVATGFGVNTSNAASIMTVNAKTISSIANTGVLSSAGTQNINSNVTGTFGAACSSSGFQNVVGNITSTAGVGAFSLSGGTQVIRGTVVGVGGVGASCLSTATQTIFGTVSSNNTGATCGSGTQTIYGNVAHTAAGASGFDGVNCTLTGIQNITGDISTNDTLSSAVGILYSSSATSKYIGNVTASAVGAQVSNGVVTINGNIVGGTGTGAETSAGVLTIYGNISTTTGVGATCSGSGTQNINGNISSSGNNAVLCTSGTQNINGNIAYIGVSATGIDAVGCSGTGIQNIVGNISNSDTHATTAYAVIYSSSGISSYDGNLASITSPALNVTAGTVNIGSGSRIVTAGATAATKSGGTLILEGGVSLVSTTNGMSGAGTVLVYGMIVQKFIETGITYAIGTVVTDDAVV